MPDKITTPKVKISTCSQKGSCLISQLRMVFGVLRYFQYLDSAVCLNQWCRSIDQAKVDHVSS